MKNKKNKVKKIAKAKSKCTDENLKNVLWDTLNGVRSGVVETNRAMAIVNSAATIVKIERTKLEAIRLSQNPKNKNQAALPFKC